MDRMAKVKEWINENAPMLTKVYQNKYVGMAYDRFASLPPSQQKQIILGGFAGVVALIAGYIFLAYVSLWSLSRDVDQSFHMITLLQQHQKTQAAQGSEIANLERNNQLATPGQLKEHLVRQGQAAKISTRMMKVEEMPESAGRGEDSKGGDVRIKQATVQLEKVNLRQLAQFLNLVEFGGFNLSVSSIKVTNDNKVRGYMNVEMSVVVYLFSTEAG
jgi:hypothetical protein